MNRFTLPMFLFAALATSAETPDDPAVASRIDELRSDDAGRRRSAVAALARIGDPAVTSLRDVLADGEWETRREAARALAAIGSEAAQPSLVTAMADLNWAVREAAARGLRKGAALDAATRDSIWRVRAAACEAAAKRDPSAVRRLVTDSVPEIRRAAAVAIAATGSPEYRSEMRAMLAYHDTADLGLELFAKIGGRDDAASVRGLFDSPDAALGARALRAAFVAGLDVEADVERFLARAEALRGMAGEANQKRFEELLAGVELLGPAGWAAIARRLERAEEGMEAEYAVILSRAGDKRTAPALVRLLKSKDPDVRYLALNALDRVDPLEAAEAAPGLLADSSAGVRVEAAVVLARSPEGRASLAEAWDKLDSTARRVALYALGRDAALDTRGLMGRALKSGEAWERRLAHEWFLRHRDAAYLQDVEGQFGREQDDGNRCQILASLEPVAARHAELYVIACDDGSASVRLMAVRMLGALRDRAHGHTLRRALGDTSPLVRARAIQGIANSEGFADIECFVAALLDPDASVREAVVRLVARSPRAATLMPVALAARDISPVVRWNAVEAVGAFPEDVAALLLREILKSDNDSLVRSAAARSAARFAASAEFLSGFAKAEKSPEARAALVSAAAQAGGKGAAALLKEMASDEDAMVRAAVAMGMGRSAGAADLKTLLRLSADGEISVRVAAASAIGQVPGKEAATALWACAGDASDAVRGTALAALVRRGDSVAVTRWLEQDPKSAELRTDVAGALDDGGQTTEALSLLCGTADLRHEGLALAGWCGAKLRLWETARLFFQRAAIAGEPHDTGWDWAVMMRALAAAEDGRPEAEGLIRAAVESTGTPVANAGNVAYLLAEGLLLPDLALEFARRGAADPLASPDVLDTLGWVQLRTGHAAEAEATFESIKEPPGPVGWLHRAVAQAANDHMDSAAASLREALSLQPSIAADARRNSLLLPLFARPELETWK